MLARLGEDGVEHKCGMETRRCQRSHHRQTPPPPRAEAVRFDQRLPHQKQGAHFARPL